MLRSLQALLICFVVLLGFRSFAVEFEWVSVGNPGNANDPETEYYGSVDHTFWITRHEVSVGQYVEFLNAVAVYIDQHGLYDEAMAGDITRLGAAGVYSYVAVSGRENLPVAMVELPDAMRFSNWLENGQPTGSQDISTTEDGSYEMGDPTCYPGCCHPGCPPGFRPARKPGAIYVVPSENEWYKAAYYDPATQTYLEYPTGSDAAPACTLPSISPNRANCDSAVNDRTPVGSYPASVSPYGTLDQAGNQAEVVDSLWIFHPDPKWEVARGGWFLDPATDSSKSQYTTLPMDNGYGYTGFRIVRLLPEPGRMLLGLAGLFAVYFLGLRRDSAHVAS